MKLRNLTLATTVILLPSPAYAQYFECEACPAGTWNNGNYESCQKCAAGTYSTGGASSCTNCPVGKYSTGGASSCRNCPAGKYASSTGSASCTNCSAGTYSTGGASSCTKCAAGTYSGAGSYYCYPCPSGYYSNAGASSCTNCLKTGVASCSATTGKATSCKSGFGLLSGACSQCSAGTYSPGGRSGCYSCSSGYYSNAGASSCTNCLTTGVATCDSKTGKVISCKAGYRFNSSNGTCTICPAGTFSATGAVSCSACPDYHWSNAGSSGCGEIRVSMYRSFWDEDDFKNCPIGSYKTVYASTPQKCNWYVFDRSWLEEWGNGAFLSPNERKLAEITGYTSSNFDKDGRCRSCTDYGNTYASCPSWGGCPTYDYYIQKIHKKSDCGPGCSHIWKDGALIDLRACRKLPCEVSGTYEGRRVKLNTDGYVYHAHEGQSFSNSGVSVEWSGNHTLQNYGFAPIEK